MFISLSNDNQHLINLNQVQTITLLKRREQDKKHTQIKFKFVDREFFIINDDATAIYEDLVRKLTQLH